MLAAGKSDDGSAIDQAVLRTQMVTLMRDREEAMEAKVKEADAAVARDAAAEGEAVQALRRTKLEAMKSLPEIRS
eukprot:4227291-Pyramimonas_sp.AAC.1